MKKIIKWWNLTVSIFLIAEIILIILFIAPNLFSIKSYVITSSSMEPEYPLGSLIYVKSSSIKSLKKGDNIAYYISNSRIVAAHKIYKLDTEENGFITYGINNKDDDGNILKDPNLVSYEDIIGKIVFCIPYLGYINKYITKQPVAYIILSFTFLNITVSYLITHKNKVEVNKNEETN